MRMIDNGRDVEANGIYNVCTMQRCIRLRTATRILKGTSARLLPMTKGVVMPFYFL
jgi:hypothetical protein